MAYSRAQNRATPHRVAAASPDRDRSVRAAAPRMCEPTDSRRRIPTIGWWASGLIAGALAAFLVTASPTRTGETGVYRKAAERMLRGEQFYCPHDPPGFTYPPFMALPYAPLTLLPDRAARMAWCMINLGLLAAIVWMTNRLARPAALAHIAESGGAQDRRRTALAVGLIAVLTARYELPQLAYQGHDYLVYFFSMLAIAAWARDAGVRMGAFAGLAAAAKATPLLFLPVFLWQRRWRAGVAMVAGVLLASLLPDLLFPSRDGGLWAVAWYQKFVAHVDIGAAPDVAGSWASWNPLNQSLSGTLYRLFTRVDDVPGTRWDVSLVGLIPAALRILTIGTELAVMSLLLYCAWPGHTRGASRQEQAFAALGQGGAVLCGLLLLSPMSSVQHFCFLLAPISYCCVDFLYRRRDLWVGAGLGLLACNAIACGDIIGGHAHRQLQAYGHLTWVCLMTMALCAYILRSRAKAAREARDGAADEDDSPHILPLAPLRAGKERRKAA